MTEPRISVLMPCFNDGEWLDEAVESVFAQTFQDFEIIIVDDGSTDPSTCRKLSAYSAPRTRVYRTENRGLPAARNYAAARAAGSMFCALDADDVLAPTWFEKSAAVLDGRPDLAFVSHWLEAFGDEQWIWRPTSCDLQALLVRNTVNGAALVRRTAFDVAGGYDEKMRDGCEDWDFWLRLVERGLHGTIIPEVLFYYRRRAASMSRRMLRPGAYRVPLTALVSRHASAYEAHLGHVLVSKEIESVDLFREVWGLQRDQVAVTAPSLSRAEEELDAAVAKASRQGGPYSRQQQRVLEEKVSSLEAHVEAVREHAGNLEHLLREATRHAENLERRVSELSTHAAGLESSRADLTRWVDSLQRERDAASAVAVRSQEETTELRTELMTVRSSYSWMVTRPLRILFGWVARRR